MSDAGKTPAASAQPQQSGGARLNPNGTVQQIGQVFSSKAGEDTKDITNTGQQTMGDTNPQTGKPWTPEERTAEIERLSKPENQTETQEARAARELAEQTTKDGEKDPKTSDIWEAPKDWAKPDQAALDAYKAESAKVDLRSVPYAEELINTGTVSEASREKAAKEFNVPRALVDAYFQNLITPLRGSVDTANAAQAAKDTARVTAVQALAGGETQWGDFAKWANANLPEADLKTLGEAIDKGSEGVAKSVTESAIAKWKASGASTEGARDVTKNLSAAGGANQETGYTSRAEQTAAINDPKYSRDETYRNAVDRRIALSKF